VVSKPPESQQQVERFFDLSLELLAIVRADGEFSRLNPAWQSVLGWSSDELNGSKLTTFVHPDDVDETTQQLATLSGSGNTTVSFVNRFRHSDGSYRELRWSVTSDDDGQLFAVARDVTEYRNALAEAKDNEDLWRAILRTAADPIILIDEKGVMLRASDATTTMFGYERSELIGQNVSMLMPEPYRSEHDSYLARYMTTGEARIIGIGREVEAQRADGSVFPLALAVSEVKLETGRRVFTGVIHDLTDRNAAEKLLLESNATLEQRVSERTAELERSNRDLEQFAYIASHDLRSPLRNVRQGMDLLDEHLMESLGTSFDDEANELRRLITAAIVRMEDLIDGLLSYSQVQRQGLPLTEMVDLSAVVNDVTEQLRVDLEAVNATVTATDLPTVAGDLVQLRQLIQNLIQNAVKYRSPDRPPQITLSATSVEGRWRIAVADNGIGVDEHQHQRIFELFRRGHAGYDGVGLGLAICQRIVARHDGEIWVDSAPGDGATFLFTLPDQDEGQNTATTSSQ